MTEGCAHCARLKDEVNRLDGKEEVLRGQLADLSRAVWPDVPLGTTLPAVIALAEAHRSDSEQVDAYVERLAAISRRVAALEAEWRAEKAENEQEAKAAAGYSMAGPALALERASKLEDCIDALQTLRESIKGA